MVFVVFNSSCPWWVINSLADGRVEDEMVFKKVIKIGG